MRPVVEEVPWAVDPAELAARLGPAPGVVLLESARFDAGQGRYSFVAHQPFLAFRSWGSRCELRSGGETQEIYGNPWNQLDLLMSRCELLDELELPFPLGGCFGFWGYDLKNFVEPTLPRTAINDLELPDCAVGFYSSLVVFDHHLHRAWVVAAGLRADGSRSESSAHDELSAWRALLAQPDQPSPAPPLPLDAPHWTSSLSEPAFLAVVARAREYIRLGHIYQVNLSHRLSTEFPGTGWQLYRALTASSPAPFAAYLHAGDFELASSSPELFLRLSGSHIRSRPIKGTRPRGADPAHDAALAHELETSPKERAELVMITDLLRNDLGRVCQYGTITVPELFRLERYAQVQHLVSTICGRLRPGVTHFEAFASCFPGGSITGAPKIRAMQIIDELEPVSRGPYTGALGYLGFNRESQLSIAIRTAIATPGHAHFHAGAGIVADSSPAAEYQETLDKALGFLAALGKHRSTEIVDR